jgi:hypothetical protein
MTAMSYAPAVAVAPADIPAARQRNRAEHYWPRIEAASGRKKLREAKDYFAALLNGQPPEVVEQAIEAVEALLGVSYERK